MIRRTVSTVSAAAVLALGAAAPALAWNQQPTSTTSPQAQREHAKSADHGFFRHRDGHHRGFEQQSQGATEQSTNTQQESQQGSTCHHGGSQND